jgi:hypothetical protein
MAEHNPSQFWELDLKTEIVDKLNETGTKNGAIAYLNNQEWCKVVETGEDYSIWIKDLSRKQNGNKVNISFNLEIQEPSAMFEGKTFKKRHFELTYDMDNYLNGKDSVQAQLIAERFKKYAEDCKRAGQISAFINNQFLTKSPDLYLQTTSKIISWILNYVNDPGTWRFQQYEAVVCGAEVLGQLKEWIWEKENGIW